MTLSRFYARLTILSFLMLGSSVRAQDLKSFGFGSMGAEATGHRPVLLLQVDFASTPMRTSGGRNFPAATRERLRLSTEDLSAFIFDFVNPKPKMTLYNGRTVNQAFAEMSGGRFLWARGEVLPPLQLTVAETQLIEETSEEVVLSGVKGTLWGFDTDKARDWLVRRVLRDNPFFDPGRFNLDRDGQIDASELVIILVTNWTDFPATLPGQWQGGANRSIALERVTSLSAGGMINLNTRICFLDQHASFSTWAHELSHHLNAIDLYIGNQVDSGANSYHFRSSLMGPTISGTPDDPAMWHLDAWHKLALGWEEPRLVRIEHGGGFQLNPAQVRRGGEAILLHSGSRIPGKPDPEYFLLEYRNPAPPSGPGYDSHVAGEGLYIWHVARDSTGAIYRLPDPVMPSGPNPNGPQSVFVEGRNASSTGYRLGGDNRDNTTQVWASDRDPWPRVLPELRWLDGTAIPGQLMIRRGDLPGTLFAEWVVVADHWVDSSGPVRAGALGTAESPWPTLAAATRDGKWGATVHCRPSVSKETGTFNRRMALKAEGGFVTFGRR